MAVQSSGNPFGGSPTGPNYEYWLSTQGMPAPNMQSRQFAAMQQRQQNQQGGGGGSPTPVGMVQQAGYQGLQAAQNPVLPPSPPAMEIPTMQSPMGLGELLSYVPGYQPLGSYGAQSWQLPSYGAPAGSTAPSGGPTGTPTISTGINIPQMSGPAGAPSMPTPPAWAAGAPTGSIYDMSTAPLAGQLAGDYYAQSGPLNLAAQQAQAGAGLGWGKLYNDWMQNQMNNQLQQQSMLYRLLGGFG